jgi:hypothetical protein
MDKMILAKMNNSIQSSQYGIASMRAYAKTPQF